eukprot:CAMPEP_0180510766 /NCGR_PEP_ID=MMETSP1036_2-20121128/50590_1 /TAXON_ID=632150 /ORGANISM="Azadinium spinosum, Strain 3D9" /LENGTH=152 /DNA_ID=CAMNT_0022521581 /DNA_START=126 /DNA_END=584 /DNA_ORIENTATION=+
MKPFSQFDRPSMTSVSTTSVLRNNTASAFMEPNCKSIGWPSAQPHSTENGTTRRAICVAEPTAMPMANPGRSCMAKRMALACSQALPANGKIIMPMNSCGIRPDDTTCSMVSMRTSEAHPITRVTTAIKAIEQDGVRLASTTSSSTSASSSG